MIKLNWYLLSSWHILEIKGRFIVKHLTKVRLVLEELERHHAREVAIDLSQTVQLDSSAITILMNFKKRIDTLGGQLLLIRPNKDISEIFSIVGFEKVMPIVDSIEEFKNKYTFKPEN